VRECGWRGRVNLLGGLGRLAPLAAVQPLAWGAALRLSEGRSTDGGSCIGER
jgi:hypothetical protein